MPDEYKIGRHRGKLALIYRDAEGRRRRYTLGTSDPNEARRLAPALFAELTRPRGTKVRDIWAAYIQEMEGRAVVATMTYTWRALEPRFGDMDAASITVEDCQAHIDERRAAGIKDGTIHTELGHLRMVLLWGVKRKMLSSAPHIERPAKPKPAEDKHLTREEVRRLFDAASAPHVRLAAVLLYTTAARSTALLGLTWDRCDFANNRIDLRDPAITVPHKGRAIVPMLQSTKIELLKMHEGALTPYVIEWAGKPVRSVKRGLAYAAKAAGITRKVTPHVLRHTAAVHMAEEGVAMEEIAQFLGHSDVNVTRRIYARFSPTYLRNAASALEFHDVGGTMASAGTS